METRRVRLFHLADGALPRVCEYAPSLIACVVMLAMSGGPTTSAQAQSISSFTIQDQSQPAFNTDFPKRTSWAHQLSETHTASAAHVHFTSALKIDVEGTTASTAASTSRFTTTIAIEDVLHCGWTLRFSGRRIGWFYVQADKGATHAEVHALTASWSKAPTSGSLDLPEVDSGSLNDYLMSGISQSSVATLDGFGSQTVTITFAWDTYASGDPNVWLDAPPIEVGFGNGSQFPFTLASDPDKGYFLDIQLQACNIRNAGPSAITSTRPTLATVGPNGSCCFDVIVRDSMGVPSADAPVVVDCSGCDVTLCPTQDPGVTADLVAKTVTAITNASGLAHFCVCASISSPCTATVISDGVVLGTVPIVNCPTPTPGPIHGYPVSDDQYRIVFDLAVDPLTATNTVNYALASFGTVNAAVMDGTVAVILTVSPPLPHGQLETVSVNGIKGLVDGIAMTTPRSVAFVTGVLSVAEARAPDPDSLAGIPCVDRSRFAGAGPTAGTPLTVQGIATAGSGGLYYLQDEAGGPRSGMTVFSPPESLVAGHRYVVAGAVDTRFGMSELTNPVYLRDDGVGSFPSAMMNPVSTLLDQTCDATQSLVTSDDLVGALVSVDSVLVTANADSGGDFHVAGRYGVFADTIRVENDGATYAFTPGIGQLLKVTGILAFESGRFELHPRGDADIAVLGSLVGVGPGSPESGAALWVSVSPNPARAGCRLDFVVPRAALTRLVVYNAAGRRVKTLINSQWVAGPHSIGWDGRDDNGSRAPSGTYFVRLSARGDARVTRVVVLK